MGLREWWQGGMSLTAAATPATPASTGYSTQSVGGTSPGDDWQARAFAYEKQLAPIHYAAQFHEGNLAKLELIPQQMNADGEWENSDNPAALELIDRMRGVSGTFADVTGRFARLMFLAGDGNLSVMLNSQQREVWKFRSNRELHLKRGSTNEYELRETGSGQPKTLKLHDPADNSALQEGEVIVYRLWREDSEFSGRADAPMRGVLDDCEELVMLCRSIRATALSRTVRAGILKVPSEVSPVPVVVDGRSDDPKNDPFLSGLIEAMTAPVTDLGTAASVVPFIVRGQAEALKSLEHLTIGDPNAAFPESQLRTEVTERIAMGIDLPVEILLGAKGVNHWSKWAIDDDTWEAHLQPVAEMLCDSLTDAIMFAVMGAGWRVWYDNARIVAHPNKSQDAKDSLDRGAISYERYLEDVGYNQSDMAGPEDLARLAYVHSNGVSAGGGAAQGAESAPEAAPAGAASRLVHPDAVRAAAIIARQQCRRIAGNRIRSSIVNARSAENQARKQLIDGVQNELVWSVLAREHKLNGHDADALVENGAGCMIDALSAFGVPRETALLYARATERQVAAQMREEASRWTTSRS